MKKLILISVLLLVGPVVAQDGTRIHRYKHFDTTKIEDFQKVKSRRLTTDINAAGIFVKAWDECFFKINLLQRMAINVDFYQESIVNGQPAFKYGNDKFRFRMYVTEYGAFEFDAIIRKRPANGKYYFPFNIESKGLTFWFQPPLTQAEIDDGDFRPDSVVNSYAVYHSSRDNNKRIINGTDTTFENYETGKAFHVYRPKIWDAAGDTVWGFVEIDTLLGKMTIGPDPTWAANADLPIYVDPTFGFSTKGGTASGNAAGSIWGLGPHAPASSGDATSVSFWADGISGEDFTLGIYDDVSSLPENLLRDTPGGTGGADGWQTQTLDSDLGITGSTNYWLAVAFNDASTQYYDAVGGFSRQRNDAITYVSGTMEDPMPSLSGSTSRKYSIYATYTETVSVTVGDYVHGPLKSQVHGADGASVLSTP